MNTQAVLRSLFTAAAFAGTALAQDAAQDARQRCSERISAALTNRLPQAPLAPGADPKASVPTLLASPEFIENFSCFINSSFNDDRGESSAEDAAYHLAKHVLENKLPWKNLFNGAYDFTVTGNGNRETVAIVDSKEGLGYFHTKPWMIRYAGNEDAGIRIVAAYRILNNITGLTLLATQNAPDADVSAKGREAPACKICHYDSWSALDKVAKALGRVKGSGMRQTFDPPDGKAHEMLGGLMIKDDRELVEALLKSENFSFNACRLVFSYLYGRQENSCEAKVFDQCVDTFKSTERIQDAIKTVIDDPNYCQ